MLGHPTPGDPLDLPWDEMADTPGIPRGRQVGGHLRSFEVRERLLVILNEEWHHRKFAERDLDRDHAASGTCPGVGR